MSAFPVQESKALPEEILQDRARFVFLVLLGSTEFHDQPPLTPHVIPETTLTLKQEPDAPLLTTVSLNHRSWTQHFLYTVVLALDSHRRSGYHHGVQFSVSDFTHRAWTLAPSSPHFEKRQEAQPANGAIPGSQQ